MAKRPNRIRDEKQRIEQVKRLTITALVSRDELLDRLVLKGGNAVAHTGAAAVRSSLDVDFSIDGSLEELGSIDELRGLFEQLLTGAFRAEGLRVFDVALERRPLNLREDLLGDFWGGYQLAFKVLDQETYDRLGDDENRRRQAIEVGPSGRRKFTVDLSKHEFCDDKQLTEIDGYNVYVYSDRMFVCEKIRAICQQMPEYREAVMSSSASPRARDFFDVHHVVTTLEVEMDNEEFWGILRQVFSAKKVPLRLLGKIDENREFHRDDFASVESTVSSEVTLLSFDEYVDFLVEQLTQLEARWVEDPPPV